MPFSQRRLRALALISAIIIIGTYFIITNPNRLSSPFVIPTKSIPNYNDGRVHWRPGRAHYPVTSLIPLPTGKKVSIPAIQAKPKRENSDSKTERLKRQAVVKASFVHSWEGYKKYAWLKDEVGPVAGGYKNTFGGWAATLVDALDTLWIMGLKEDFEMAVQAVEKIDFTTTDETHINVFETTIRYLGGFLAAYDISGGKYPLLLAKAVEVGDFLMDCFDTPNRMPISRWDWRAYLDNIPQEAPKSMIVSELGSLSIEFTRLSQITGDGKYYDAIQRVSDVFEKYQNQTQLPGMWPVVVDAATPSFTMNNEFHIGGMSDSLYEYLPKQFLMLGGHLAQPRIMYEKAIEVAKKHLFFRVLNPKDTPLLVSGEIKVYAEEITLGKKGQHLGCFIGGMAGIASKIFNRPDELEVAQQLTEGCVWAYDSQTTGIAPEIFSLASCKPDDCQYSEEKWHDAIQKLHFIEDEKDLTAEQKVLERIQYRRLAPGFTNIDDPRYILRPEAIESVFIMYRITGDPEWQDKAWRMFERIEKWTRTEIASSAIDDVTAEKPNKMNSMESFWLAETLKYFYLVFAEMDVVSLDEYVLNTEAHPLKRPDR